MWNDEGTNDKMLQCFVLRASSSDRSIFTVKLSDVPPAVHDTRIYLHASIFNCDISFKVTANPQFEPISRYRTQHLCGFWWRYQALLTNRLCRPTRCMTFWWMNLSPPRRRPRFKNGSISSQRSTRHQRPFPSEFLKFLRTANWNSSTLDKHDVNFNHMLVQLRKHSMANKR